MESNKTIFISAFFGLIARNILATDILSILSQKQGLRIVILAPKGKSKLYKDRFESKNIIVEGVNSVKFNRIEQLFFSLFLNSSDTNSRCICRYHDRRKNNLLIKPFFWWLLAKLSNLKIARELLRSIDYRFMNKTRFSGYFKKYSPDLVFSTDVFEPDDVALMREAKFRNIPTVGMVRSWDNITTHGLNRIIPDKLIVNTPNIKSEAVKYNDIKSENIFVVGIPHYDNYSIKSRIDKKELFKELGLDPNKKTVFFAPPAKIFIENDPINRVIISELKQLEDVQIILRLYFVGDVDIGDTKPIPGKLAIDAPPSGKDFVEGGLSLNDRLPDFLCHSDVIITFASTLAIDAIVFNKPVIFIGFDGKPDCEYWESLRRFYDFDHQRSLLDADGIKLANSLNELIEYVKSYIHNSDLDKEEREKIINDRCWKLDGKSSERLAYVLIRFLESCYRDDSN